MNKEDIISGVADKKNTGCTESQIALLTYRIKELTSHLKKNHKDKIAYRGLIKLVSRRKTFINYLKKNNEDSYIKIIEKLKLRK